MSIDCAVCKIKLGLLNHGLHRLQMILRTQLPDIQRAKANYHSGLVFLELGKEDFARAAFEVALIAQPRHEGAKKEVENFQRRDTIKELRKEHPKLRKCLLPPAMI